MNQELAFERGRLLGARCLRSERSEVFEHHLPNEAAKATACKIRIQTLYCHFCGKLKLARVVFDVIAIVQRNTLSGSSWSASANNPSTRQRVRELPFVLPPLLEQQEIVRSKMHPLTLRRGKRRGGESSVCQRMTRNAAKIWHVFTGTEEKVCV